MTSVCASLTLDGSGLDERGHELALAVEFVCVCETNQIRIDLVRGQAKADRRSLHSACQR